MSETKEQRPQYEWETSRYAEDIKRILREREGSQWIGFDHPETAEDPEFIRGVDTALRDFGHVPVWMESRAFPEEPRELHLDQIHRALVEKIIASLPQEEREETEKYVAKLDKERPREVLKELSTRLWAEEKYLTVFWKPLEDILERIPEGPERDFAVLNLFKAIQSVIKGGHYAAMIVNEDKLNGLKVNRMAFDEAAYTHIRS